MRSLAIAAVGVLVGTSALAADLGVATKAPPPVMMQSYDWSGFYIGVQGGYAWGKSDAVFSLPSFFATSQKYDIDGGMAGGLIGWNYQFAGTPWVIGLEADINWANIRGHSRDIFPSGVANFYETRIDWYGTVRGRLGYAWGPSLLYATGGLAYGEVKTGFTVPSDPSENFSLTETRVGYTVGAGWEWMFASNWTLRAEYNYVNLGEQTLLLDGPFVNTRFDNDFHVVKGAITYKFGGGPVVARY
jgi:outer membrane immunogenic protein